MFSALALIILGFGFAVLVGTFFWIARILSMRREVAPAEANGEGSGEGSDAVREESADDVSVGEKSVDEGSVDPEEASEVDDEEEERLTAVAMAHGSNFGLILGILACVLFKVSLLMLMLSVGGIIYSGRTLWYGIRRHGIMIIKALIGLLLSLASIGLQFLETIGQLADIISSP